MTERAVFRILWALAAAVAAALLLAACAIWGTANTLIHLGGAEVTAYVVWHK